MKKAKWTIHTILVFLILLGGLAWRGGNAAAQTPERQTTIVVPYTEYEWWMIRWETNQIVCRFLTDHEGMPTESDVKKACGDELYIEWLTTPPCKAAIRGEQDTTTCDGLYVHMISFSQREREVIVDLPPPVVWVELEGCTPTPPENLCPTLPVLLLRGEEPLPNERIIAIHGTVDDAPFSCEGPECRLQLGLTSMAGSVIKFWAESSYGDSSDIYTAQVRILDTGVTMAPGGAGWYVDVISTQWRGAPIASCVRIWQAFPPVGAPPSWLSTPESSELMNTDEPYFYLAGRLIVQELVDVSDCPSGGLLPNGYADACGLERARSLVDAWQDLFDERIVEEARVAGIPAQLMKNLFAQESQFWPGVFRVPYEFGLGQMTDKGTDTVLLWNEAFFNQFCPLVLAQDACDGGYLSLNSDNQGILRGALALQVKADCPECPTGIDLTNVDFSLGFFATTLQANCQQVSQIVLNATGEVAGSVSSYEDLWRFTITNYHAGPGCLSFAAYSAWQSTGLLNWEEVSSRLPEACRGAVPYVEKIAR